MAGNKLGKDGVGYVWSRVFNLIKLITGDVAVSEKGNLQEQVDTLSETVQDCFTSVSNGKQLVANAITDKGVTTAIDAEFATMATNIAQIKTQGTMQAKTASLSTSAQTIKPDTGYDGLSQVVVPAVNGTAGTGDVVASKTFSSASGINQTGTLADKTGTTDHQATASLDTTNSRLKLKIPALAKYGTGNYLYAAYSTIASLIGLTAAKLVKGNTILGIAGNSNNMDTSGCDATAQQILSGKKAGVKGSLITGTMKNDAGTTVATSGITQDDTYTYAGIPEAAYYDTNSKVRIPNTNLNKELEMNNAVIIAPKTNYTTTSNGVIIFSAMDTSTAIESQSSVYMQIDGNNYNEFKSSKSSSGYYQGVMIKNVNKNSVIYCSNTGLEGYIIVFIPFS